MSTFLFPLLSPIISAVCSVGGGEEGRGRQKSLSRLKDGIFLSKAEQKDLPQVMEKSTIHAPASPHAFTRAQNPYIAI